MAAANDKERPPGRSSGASTEDGAGGRDDLAQQLSELARALQAEEGPDATLERLVRAGVDLIPGADDASLSVVRGPFSGVLAASDERAAERGR